MRKRVVLALLVGAVLALAALATAAAVSPSDFSSRAGEYNGARTGEVLYRGDTVLSIRTSAGRLDPLRRAQIATERLQGLSEESYRTPRVTARTLGQGRTVHVNDTLIVTVSPAEARAHRTTPAALASVWADNLARALRGEVIGGGGPPGQYDNWVGQKQKWVPIFSLEQEGVRIGAAQVAGPAGQVDQVRGVAQLRLDFRNLARIYAYIPVSTISVSDIDRVQGVSVWATGDIQLVGF